MQKRSPAVVILLSIITCGIYSYYWICVVTNDIQRSLRKPDGSVPNGGLAVLFSIISCGIYLIYWWYKQGQRIAILQQEHGMPVSDSGVVYLVLSIFGLSIISAALMQSAINSLIDNDMQMNGNYQNGNNQGYINNQYMQNNQNTQNGNYGDNSARNSDRPEDDPFGDNKA